MRSPTGLHHISTSAARWAAFHSFCPPIAGSQHTHMHPPLLSWGFVLLPLEAAIRRHLRLLLTPCPVGPLQEGRDRRHQNCHVQDFQDHLTAAWVPDELLNWHRYQTSVPALGAGCRSGHWDPFFTGAALGISSRSP